MEWRKGLLRFWVAVFLMAGCSQKAEEATQKVIDYGTGKEQVDTYQRLKKQIKTINEENAKRLNE